MFYIEGHKWAHITEQTLCSQSTMQRRKKAGLEKMAQYYALLDELDANRIDICSRVRFVSYLHEERFAGCLKLAGQNRTPGVEALLYIISGCNELWNAGVETFYDCESGLAVNYADISFPISDGARRLLQLAFCLAGRFERNDLAHTLHHYFPGLEYVHLELAIEAIKIPLFPRKSAQS